MKNDIDFKTLIDELTLYALLLQLQQAVVLNNYDEMKRLTDELKPFLKKKVGAKKELRRLLKALKKRIESHEHGQEGTAG